MLHIAWKRRSKPCGTLCQLQAWEFIQAQQEALELAPSDSDFGLCFNACVLSRALLKGKNRMFMSGETVLRELTETQIDAFCRKYLERFSAQINQSEDGVNPAFDAARYEELKRQ